MSTGNNRFPRKLAAVLYADVAGYSRLTGADEDGTHRRVSACLDLLSTSIGSHSGKVIHYAGDAVLAEFSTVTDCMECAVAVQAEIEQCNRDLPDGEKVRFRIGVNMGEVIVDRGDIYGDGVNVAARLEALADPGGICVSESVHSAIGNKLPIEWEFMGEQSVKNIDRTIRVYRVLTEGISRVETRTPRTVSDRYKPAIAVLPFNNMSGDAEQEYFSDGITEDIITELSRFSELTVIARNSSFTYRGQSVRITDVAKDLGARYVVEGSVRRVAERVRVTVQLIDGENDEHLWAEKFDGSLEDVFGFQDEIVARVAGSIAGRVDVADLERVNRMTPGDLRAYDHCLRGQAMIYRGDVGDMARAREALAEALALDPGCARAHANISLSYCVDIALKEYDDRDRWLRLALEHAEEACRLDRNDSLSQWAMSESSLFAGDFDRARQHIDRAMQLNPNDADILAWACLVYAGVGDGDEGVELADRAILRNPFHPDWYLWLRGYACWAAGRYREALETTDRIAAPNIGVLRVRAVAFAELDRMAEAQTTVEKILGIEPSYTIADVPRGFKDQAEYDRWLNGLRKAGLPEQ